MWLGLTGNEFDWQWEGKVLKPLLISRASSSTDVMASVRQPDRGGVWGVTLSLGETERNLAGACNDLCVSLSERRFNEEICFAKKRKHASCDIHHEGWKYCPADPDPSWLMNHSNHCFFGQLYFHAPPSLETGSCTASILKACERLKRGEGSWGKGSTYTGGHHKLTFLWFAKGFCERATLYAWIIKCTLFSFIYFD